MLRNSRELEKIHKNFINDPIIKKINEHIFDIYSKSVPVSFSIGIGFSYNEKTQKLINYLMNERENYIKGTYGKYLNVLQIKPKGE
jgi:hypothetical protein